jgi:hypothetical protein
LSLWQQSSDRFVFFAALPDHAHALFKWLSELHHFVKLKSQHRLVLNPSDLTFRALVGFCDLLYLVGVHGDNDHRRAVTVFAQLEQRVLVHTSFLTVAAQVKVFAYYAFVPDTYDWTDFALSAACASMLDELLSYVHWLYLF